MLAVLFTMPRWKESLAENGEGPGRFLLLSDDGIVQSTLGSIKINRPGSYCDNWVFTFF